MKQKLKRFFSLFLAIAMALSLAITPAGATAVQEPAANQPADAVSSAAEGEGTAAPAPEETPEEEPEEAPARETVTVEEQYGAYTVNANEIDISVDPNAPIVDGDAEVDKDDPAIVAVEEELRNMVVLADDGSGEKVALTEDQIQTVLYLYGQYQDQWKANADVLGVQMPFYLQYNDNGEDGLGTLGEMLVLANVTVDQVRSGEYSYDDLVGMIQNFLYGDQLGVKYYGAIIENLRDEALAAVKASGAQTEVQKLLVLNDWLATVDTFDMSYIMNSGKEDPPMKAETPVEHEHYQDVYDTLYAVYEQQLTQQFHDQIYNGIVAQFRQQYYEKAIKNGYYQGVYNKVLEQMGVDEETATEEQKAQADEAATEETNQFMTENADAISEDAVGFVEATFDPEVAAQISAGADAFIEEAETDGVEVDPENNPGNKMTIEQITQKQMEETPLDELGGKTANEAIPVYAADAAEGLTTGVLGYWEGSHIGALAEGKSVCLGYAKAFAYLVQAMHPEIYGTSADADMSDASNWKTASELYYDDAGNLDINQNYVVDLVRITFQTDVTMYGESDGDFNSDHFWNAVKVDGQWYYIDPCYTDCYSEVMIRDRVETDGYMNHLYFMFSHTTTTSLYDGYYSEIKSLYSNAATDTKYEDSWFARAKSNVYSDGSNAYYVYDSTDLIGMLDQFNNSNNSDYEDMMNEETIYKLVRHPLTGDDTAEGDSDYTALIEFNYKENEDDEDSVVRVLNADGEMVENELLTELYARHAAEAEVYPSIAITTALYDGKLYFNLSNCILSYDLTTCEVTVVKEYNTVYGQRDKTNAFAGMAFNLVDSEANADFTFENHPIAGICVKGDELTVSIATNLAYISGKDDGTRSKDNNYTADREGYYGYAFEESNYNPNYSNYDTGYDDSMMEAMGYTKEKNDNDEFMWVANFVGTLDMKHFAGASHNYAEVEIAPFCGRNGYTENRCTTCGAIEAGSRVEEEGSACDEHHYVHFDEQYFTKDSNGSWNTGNSYVCVMCGYAISEPTEPSKGSQMSDEDYQEAQRLYEEQKAIYDHAAEIAGHTYAPTDAEWSEDNTSVTFKELACTSNCADRVGLIDCYLEDDTINVTLSETATATAEVTSYEGECTTGVIAVYTAAGEAEGYKYIATKKVEQEAGKHAYEGEFTWTEVLDEEGNPTGEYTATANLTCAVCGDKQENVEATVALNEELTKAAACEEVGQTVYTATATVKDADGNEIGSATDNKIIEVPALGHKYEAEFTWAEDNTSATATFTCANGCGENYENVAATISQDVENNQAPTCTESGKIVYVATATATKTVTETDEEGNETEKTVEVATATDTKEVEVSATGHKYGAAFTWAEDCSSATVALTCSVCGDVQEVAATVAKDEENSVAPTCTAVGTDVYVATAEYEGVTYTDSKSLEVAMIAHTPEERGAQDPTCTEPGYSSATVCSVCGTILESSEEIPALGHDPKAEFTWAEDGATAAATITCSRCDLEEKVEATVTVDEAKSVAPTCVAAGTTVYVATVTYEGKTFTDEKSVEVPATGVHTWDEGVITVQPTTESEGEITYTCTVCGETRTEVLPKVERDGWYYNEDNGKWYYYENGQMVTGWKKVKNVWYYMDADGTMHTGWLYVNNYWYYLKPSSGAMQIGWVAVNGKWYYTNSYGEMVTGWVKVKNKWYYMWDSGSMATGWVKVKNTWYYMWDSGAMATGWVKVKNTWYYMWDSGAMATGWVKVNNKWYYMNSDGEMQTGWIRLGGKWYYLDASGAMVTGTVTINGKRYTFDSNGVMQ